MKIFIKYRSFSTKRGMGIKGLIHDYNKWKVNVARALLTFTHPLWSKMDHFCITSTDWKFLETEILRRLHDIPACQVFDMLPHRQWKGSESMVAPSSDVFILNLLLEISLDKNEFIVHVRKQIEVLNWAKHRLCAKKIIIIIITVIIRYRTGQRSHCRGVKGSPEKNIIPYIQRTGFSTSTYSTVHGCSWLSQCANSFTWGLSETTYNLFLFFVHILLKQQLLVCFCFLFRKQL